MRKPVKKFNKRSIQSNILYNKNKYYAVIFYYNKLILLKFWSVLFV